jgi:hypothetical protein
MRPPETLTIKPSTALGPFLKQAVGSNRKRFMDSCGALWPFFAIVKNKLGEDLAYEVLSYIALDSEYLNALLEVGYHDTVAILRQRAHNPFRENEGEIAAALSSQPVRA